MLFLTSLCLGLVPGLVQDEAPATPLALVGARLVPIAGPEIANGVLVIEDGLIARIGTLDATSIPANARMRDVTGMVLMPGLVDTHSHIGGPGGADGSAPLQPEVRVYDSLDVRSSGFQRAQAGGITTANVMPGSGHLLSGQTVYLKLRDGKAIADLFIRTADGGVAGGIKMANGTNSRRDPPFPGTRAKSAALVRELYVEAQEYAKKVAEADGDPEKLPERDLAMEALGEVLAGTRVVHHHTHRHDDILTVLRLREEFGFRVVLHHVSDAWKVADEIAAAGVSSSLIVVDSPGGKLEARDHIRFANGAALERAGAGVSFHTDDWDHRLATLPAQRGARRAGGDVAREGARGADARGREAARPRRTRREPRGREGRRLRAPGRRPALGLHQGDGDVGRGDEGVRPHRRAGRGVGRRRARCRGRLGTALLPPGRSVVRALGFVALCALVPVAFGQDLAVRGRTVHTAAGEPIENGIVLVQGGKITAVGAAGTLTIPGGIEVLEAEVVTPGLIDAHSVVGLAGWLNYDHDQDQLEDSGPMQPELRAIDAYNPREPLIEWVRGFGVTTVHTGHAPGALISGQTLIAKTRGDTLDEAVIRPFAMLAATFGDEALRDGKEVPGTRAKAVALLRQELLEARAHAKKLEGDEPPTRDLRLEALGQVLAGEVPLMVTAQRSHDILTAIRVAEEFELRLVLDGVAEAYDLTDEIRAAGASVILHPTMKRAWRETENLSMEAAARLHAAGIPFALQSGYESYVPKTRVVLFEAAIAASYGLGFENALNAITIDAARLLGIDDRVGSLEVGKDGDLALYDGDPFEYTSHCVGVVIEGVVVSDEPR